MMDFDRFDPAQHLMSMIDPTMDLLQASGTPTPTKSAGQESTTDKSLESDLICPHFKLHTLPPYFFYLFAIIPQPHKKTSRLFAGLFFDILFPLSI
jgi:hypothetical protein